MAESSRVHRSTGDQLPAVRTQAVDIARGGAGSIQHVARGQPFRPTCHRQTARRIQVALDRALEAAAKEVEHEAILSIAIALSAVAWATGLAEARSNADGAVSCDRHWCGNALSDLNGEDAAMPGHTARLCAYGSLRTLTVGIRFVLHATAPDVVAEAQKRARELVAFTAGRSKEKHGGGRGGGFMRNCPIVYGARDAKVSATYSADGVAITVTPNDPKRRRRAAHESARAAGACSARTRAKRRARGVVARRRNAPVFRSHCRSGWRRHARARRRGLLVRGQGGIARRSTSTGKAAQGHPRAPLTEGGWDDGDGALLRNVQIADVDGDGKPSTSSCSARSAPRRTKPRRGSRCSISENGKLVQRAETEWQHGQYTHGFGLAVADLELRRPQARRS